MSDDSLGAGGKIAVLGAGSWGTALAVMWNQDGKETVLWTPFTEEKERIRSDGENKAVLPGIKVPDSLPIETSLETTLAGAGLVILAVPSKFIRKVVHESAAYLDASAVVVSAAKGLEDQESGTPKRMSEVIEEELKATGSRCGVAVLSGPSHAEEVGREQPTTIVIAGARAEEIRNFASTKVLRMYTSDDLIGVELGGVLKNPIAIAAGISAGLGAGDNAAGALVTRGMVEISRLGVAAGASQQTFSGLSGIGDLVTTCLSKHSRNRRVGYEVGRGKKLDQVLKELGMVAEGVNTARTVDKWALRLNVETPITSGVCRVLFEGSDPRKELDLLMNRELKDEFSV